MASLISNNDNAAVFWTGLGSALLRAAGGERGKSRASLLGEGLGQLPAMLQQSQLAQNQGAVYQAKLDQLKQEAERNKRWQEYTSPKMLALNASGGAPTKQAAAMMTSPPKIGGIPAETLNMMDADTGSKMLAQAAIKTPPSSVQEYEYAKQNGYPGTFEEFRRSGIGANQAPSAVQEYQFFSRLKPEEQSRYLTMKRANPYLNLGGEMVQPNPNVPGQAMGGFAKTLPPEDRPETKGAQVAAMEAAKSTAAANTAVTKKATQGTSTLSLLEGVDDLIDKSTGSMVGAGVDYAAGAVGKATEGATAIGQLKVIQANLMLNMPRMEGPQSDRDVDLYREAAAQIGDPTVPAPIRKAAVDTIRSISRKYEAGAPKPGPAPKPAASSDEDLVKKYLGGQ